MPSLPSDVLLLAVRSSGRYYAKGDVGIVLAGALMCSEVMSGSHPIPAETDPDDLATSVLKRAAAAVDEVGKPLCVAGLLDTYERKNLGLFSRKGFLVRDPAAQWQAEQRLRAALTLKARPEPGTAALAVLCAVSGIARAVAPPPPRRDEWMALHAHLDRLRADLPIDVAAVLEATHAAYRRTGGGDSGRIPASDRGTGGDGYIDGGAAVD